MRFVRHSLPLIALLALVISGCSNDSSPSAADVARDYTATFDGNECVLEGPAEVEQGRYSFLLMNLSDKDFDLFVVRIAPDKTYQDALNQQREPGRWNPRPSWLFETTRVESSMSDAGEVSTIGLTDSGEHAVTVLNKYTGADVTQLWYCSPPFKVVAGTS